MFILILRVESCLKVFSQRKAESSQRKLRLDHTLNSRLILRKMDYLSEQYHMVQRISSCNHITCLYPCSCHFSHWCGCLHLYSCQFFPLGGDVCIFVHVSCFPLWGCMHLYSCQFFPLGGDVCIFAHVIFPIRGHVCTFAKPFFPLGGHVCTFAHAGSFPWVGRCASLLMPLLSPGWGCLYLCLCQFFPLGGDVCIFCSCQFFPLGVVALSRPFSEIL